MKHDNIPASPKTPRWALTIQRFLATRRFFWLIVSLFSLEAAWIAIGARYPQAFDEQYHFGIIQIYSHQLSPFLQSQPVSADRYGVVFRDPSFLYHYLMSFVYRLLTHLTSSQTTQLIILRLLNVGFFVCGLLLSRRLLTRLNVSPALRNLAIMLLAFMPVMPLLAAQINYDNALFPLSVGFFLLVLPALQRIRDRASIPINQLAGLLALGLAASLVKYAFLPVFAATVVVFMLYLWKHHATAFRADWKAWAKRPLSWLLVVALLLGLVLFWQREGINTLRYHTPIPECDQVLNVDRCQAFGPWARNYMFHSYHIQLHAINVLTYPFVWLYHMEGESVFTITSYHDEAEVVQYNVEPQLILMEILYWSALIVPALLAVRYWRQLWAQFELRIVLIIASAYVLVLFLQNFNDYLHVGLPVAIHGRYLLPVLPALLAAACLVTAYTCRTWSRSRQWIPRPQALLAALACLVLLLEGGFVTYIFRSDSSWFWPQSAQVQHANGELQQVLKPVVLDIKQQ